MSCGCRRSQPSLPRRAAPAATSQRKSLCVNLEAEGNNLTVTVSSLGRIHLNPPYSSSLPSTSLLPSMGCTGPFAKALLAAEAKLLGVYSMPSTKNRFTSILPGPTLKLGFLRDLLRSF